MHLIARYIQTAAGRVRDKTLSLDLSVDASQVQSQLAFIQRLLAAAEARMVLLEETRVEAEAMYLAMLETQLEELGRLHELVERLGGA